jgi:Cu(I)/Ag(I) efflux system membrane fusion protein
VRRGLAAGERVVTSGQFLLDSESQLREAIQKLLGSGDPVASPGSALSKVPGPSEIGPAMPGYGRHAGGQIHRGTAGK